jgi:hypothetical protein
VVEGCVAAATISCNGTVAGSLTGPLATDLFDSWECFSLTSYQGPEVVYSFVPQGTGLVEVTLTGMTADADLMVMRAVGGRCDDDDPAACITGATSTRGGSSDERVEFAATAGQTYYIVVDGYNGATTNFTLRVGTATRHIQFSEFSGGAPDYVEVVNRSACHRDLSGYSIHYEPDCTPIIDFSFTSSHVVNAGGVYRLIESGYTLMPNEVSTGANICDNPTSDSWAVLCHGGACDHTTTCSRVIDYAVRQDTGATGMPTCVTFNPAPIVTTGRATTDTDTRTGFTSSGTAYQRADWTVAAMSRN